MRETLLSSSILILAVLAIRALVGDKIRAGSRYALWFLVALRLMIPGTVGNSPLSIFGIAPFQGNGAADGDTAAAAAADAPSADGVLRQSPLFDPQDGSEDIYAPYERTAAGREEGADAVRAGAGLTDVYGEEGKENGGTEGDLSAGALRSYAPLIRRGLLVVWLVGAAAMLGSMGYYQITLARHLKGRRERVADVETYHGLRVYAVSDLPSPCLMGRCVYLDAETAGDERRRGHVLAHELGHHRQGDQFWAILRWLLVSVYWFDPLVWAAAYASRQDSELACDEAAIRLLGETERIAYGRTLLALVSEKASVKSVIGPALTMGGSGRRMKERIDRIARKPKTVAPAVIAAAVLAVTAGIAAFTGTEEKQEKAQMPSAAEQETDAAEMRAEEERVKALAESEAQARAALETEKAERQELVREKEQTLEALAEMKARLQAELEIVAAQRELMQQQEPVREQEQTLEALAGKEAQLRAELRIVSKQETEIKAGMGSMESMESLESEMVVARLSACDEYLLALQDGELHERPMPMIRTAPSMWTEYGEKGTESMTEGLYLLAQWDADTPQEEYPVGTVDMPAEDAEISVYGLYTAQFGFRGVKFWVGAGADKDSSNFDVPWNLLGISRVYAMETAPGEETPDGLPRTFLFRQLMPGTEEAYRNYEKEIYELYVCDRYDTGHIELSRVDAEEIAGQIKEKTSCRVDGDGKKVTILYEDETAAGVIDVSKLPVTDADATPYSVKDAFIDPDSALGYRWDDKTDSVLVTTAVSLVIEQGGKITEWRDGLPAVTFSLNLGDSFGDRECSVESPAIDVSSGVNRP